MLAEQERLKYEHVWSFKDYHEHSPGERRAPYFLKHVPWKPGQTVIDLGCGTGRASRDFVRAGLQVYLLDHVNAVDPSIHLPFISANLWELPNLRGFDWFYCVDVMEHIPTEKVDAVLDNCVAIAKGGFFQVALFPDEWHGQVLHLTVKPQDWWIEKLTERWVSVTVSTPEKGRFVAICEPRE